MCAPSTRRRARSAARRCRRRARERGASSTTGGRAAAAAAVGAAARQLGEMRHAVGAAGALSRGARERNDFSVAAPTCSTWWCPRRRWRRSP